MNWIVVLIVATVVVEAAIIWFYRWVQANAPEQGLWVILGSKVVKLLLAVVAIVAVYTLADGIDIKQFSIGVIVAYLVSLFFETVFFLKKKK